MSSPVTSAEQTRNVGDTGGLGVSPATEIVALPPRAEVGDGLDIDPKTGEPRRPALILTIIALFVLAGLTVFAGYWLHWWQAINIVDFADSANLLHWVNPRPGSVASILLVVLLAAIGAAGVTAPWVAAYNLYGGASWSRWAGVAAVVTGVLATVLLHYWVGVAIVLAAIATGLLWTAPVKQFFAQWQQYMDPQIDPIEPPTHVAYGPTSRFS